MVPGGWLDSVLHLADSLVHSGVLGPQVQGESTSHTRGEAGLKSRLASHLCHKPWDGYARHGETDF